MTLRTALPAVILPLLIAACAATPPPAAPGDDLDFGVRWVRDAAEWEALALQAYGAAAEDLPRLLGDPGFSALPDQADAEKLPPAIIADVDETLVSNVDFQVWLEPPFSDEKFDEWNDSYESRPVPGAADFVRRAREAGVTVFFVTNRACKPRPPDTSRCPQERITLKDLADTGIIADERHLMLSNEEPSWTQEKKVRRDLIARDYRVIMLIGDDLGDFIPCVRSRAVAPCTETATAGERRRWTEDHRALWGDGWYVLPNPMHGSWTSAR